MSGTADASDGDSRRTGGESGPGAFGNRAAREAHMRARDTVAAALDGARIPIRASSLRARSAP